MRPAPFEYMEPDTVDDACAALARHAGSVAVLAGGQSLLAQLNARERRPAVVVGIARIAELAAVAQSDGVLRVGAAVTQRALQRAGQSGGVPVLQEALGHVGHVPTRNRGTLGGSIAFADPTAELPAVLLALGGSVRVRSTGGERTVAAGALFTGPFTTSLGPDELLTAVELPAIDPGARWAFEQRHFRRHAKVSAVAGRSADGSALTVAVAGVGATPVLLADAAGLVLGAGSIDAGVAAAIAAAQDLVAPNGDRYGSVDYRRRLVAVAVGAALGRVLGSAHHSEGRAA